MKMPPCERSSLVLRAQADMYFSICLSRVVLRSRKVKSPDTICQGICSSPLSVFLILEWLRAAHFVSGFRRKGEIFSKIA